jgi:hypothetical protein
MTSFGVSFKAPPYCMRTGRGRAQWTSCLGCASSPPFTHPPCSCERGLPMQRIAPVHAHRDLNDFRCRHARSRVGGGGDGECGSGPGYAYFLLWRVRGARRRRCTCVRTPIQGTVAGSVALGEDECTRSSKLTRASECSARQCGRLRSSCTFLLLSTLPLFPIGSVAPMFALRLHMHPPLHPALRYAIPGLRIDTFPVLSPSHP